MKCSREHRSLWSVVDGGWQVADVLEQLCGGRRPRRHSTMDYLFPIFLLTMLSWVSVVEPLAFMMQRRRNAYPIYTRDFIDEYEPYAVAAFPVHAPMPILQVISPTAYSGKFRKQVKRPQNIRDIQAYASSNIEQAFDPYSFNQIYDDQPKYTKQNSYTFEEDNSPVVVYARPNKNGGYTYRKPAPAPASTPAPPAQKEPIIIRIHKYRVIH